MSALPPLGGVAPPLQCNRWMGGTFGGGDEICCGREGKWHIMWTSDLENGICCDDHYQEARARWAFYAAHEYRPDCSMPGAVYIFAENRCVVDEDGLGLEELESARAVGGLALAGTPDRKVCVAVVEESLGRPEESGRATGTGGNEPSATATQNTLAGTPKRKETR
jgi:hypothetical protein